MRTVALAHTVILALALGGPAWAQDQSAPARIIDVPEPVIPAPAQQVPDEVVVPPSPKVQDRAQMKGDLLPPPPPVLAESRFNFTRVRGGLIRLDGETGQIAYCAPRTGGWSCQPVPEDSAPVEKELTQLRGEVSGLKGEVSGLKDEVSGLKNEVSTLKDRIAALAGEIAAMRPPPPPPAPPPAVAPEKPEGLTLRVPTQDDIARARAYVEDKARESWRRLVDMIGDLRKETLSQI